MKLFKYLTINIFLFTTLVCAQNVVPCNLSDYGSKETQEDIARNKFYKLKNLENNNKEEYIFRIWAWMSSSCIELVKNDGQISCRIHYAVQDSSSSKTFSKFYQVSEKVSEQIYSHVKTYEFVRRQHPSGKNPVSFIILTKEGKKIERYTSDLGRLWYELSEIIETDKYDKMYYEEVPFERYTIWSLIYLANVEGEKPMYFKNKNE